jgi:hypothetical protein
VALSAFAVPQDYISQEGNHWLLHTFSETDDGYIENIFEVTAMRLRCVAQYFDQDSKVAELSTEDISRVVHHTFDAPRIIPLTENALIARLPSLNQRRQASVGRIVDTPPLPTPPLSNVESRRGSNISNTASTQTPVSVNDDSRRSTLSTTSTDSGPDFR